MSPAANNSCAERATVKEQLETLVGQMVDRGIQFDEAVNEFEKKFIKRVLDRSHGNQSRAARLLNWKAVVNVVLREQASFTKSFRLGVKIWCFSGTDISTLEFASANPTVIKSIKQRDLLNTWLRLYARAQALPRMADYRPERLDDELPDLVAELGTHLAQVRLDGLALANQSAPFGRKREVRMVSIRWVITGGA